MAGPAGSWHWAGAQATARWRTWRSAASRWLAWMGVGVPRLSGGRLQEDGYNGLRSVGCQAGWPQAVFQRPKATHDSHVATCSMLPAVCHAGGACLAGMYGRFANIVFIHLARGSACPLRASRDGAGEVLPSSRADRSSMRVFWRASSSSAQRAFSFSRASFSSLYCRGTCVGKAGSSFRRLNKP